MMRTRVLVHSGFASLLFLFFLSPSGINQVEEAHALEAQRYTVYCADRRIEVSMWDLEQMKVRRGSNVCQFTSYTSYGDALNFAAKNFGGEGAACTC